MFLSYLVTCQTCSELNMVTLAAIPFASKSQHTEATEDVITVMVIAVERIIQLITAVKN